MLIKFEVENFKNFKEKLVFDLSASTVYEFNNKIVTDGGNKKYLNKGVIVGENGSGKSNLGLAIFDIVKNLTENTVEQNSYFVYTNLDSDKKNAIFKYTFIFEEKLLVYEYAKSAYNQLVYEKIFIDNVEFISYDFINNIGYSKISGSENLRLNYDNNMNISRVKFILNTALLQENLENKIIIKFKKFIDRMLLFYSLEKRGYIGFKSAHEKISSVILEKSSIQELEEFLASMGIYYSLIEKEIDGEKNIYCRFKDRDVNYFNVISTGTSSLTLFYYWFLEMREMSFVYIDEFDAFYHFELSKKLVNKLINDLPNTQVFLTTHNTNLIQNNILRPDAYFKMDNNSVTSFEKLTDKNIKQAHDIQKMYKGGAF